MSNEKDGHIVLVLLPSVGGSIIINEAIDEKAERKALRLIRDVLAAKERKP